jgi:hypothetical protein
MELTVDIDSNFWQFYEVMSYFLKPESEKVWSEVQSIAAKGDHQTLRKYVREAQRLTTTQRNVRVATKSAQIDGKSIAPGNLTVLMLVSLHSISAYPFKNDSARLPLMIFAIDRFVLTFY